MSVKNTDHGFVWDDIILVERTTKNLKKPKFHLLRIYDYQGTCIEILMRPRSTKITKHKNKGR
jgi:hypothetical protein